MVVALVFLFSERKRNFMKEKENKKEKSVFLQALSLSWELGYIIAIPLVAMALGGRFLDDKYDSSPIFLLSGILLAVLISGILVFKKSKRILEEASKKQ